MTFYDFYIFLVLNKNQKNLKFFNKKIKLQLTNKTAILVKIIFKVLIFAFF